MHLVEFQSGRFGRGLTLLTATVGILSLMLVMSVWQPVAAQADPSTGGSVLVGENFTGSSVVDPKFVALGSACITGAAIGSTPAVGASTLSNCDSYQVGAVPTRGTGSAGNGWLQLTDASGGNMNNNSNGSSNAARTGGVLYNQSLPASAGLHVQFEQAQYGGYVNGTNGANDATFRAWGADGISFFLADGSYNLTATGASGGSLGYAQKTDSTPSIPGVVGGFLGLGLDAWGNFPRQNEGRGTGCSAQGLNPGLGGNDTFRNSVVLRGAGWQDSAGAWTQGYCLLQTSQLPTATQNLREPWNATLAATDHDAYAVNAARWVDIEISPVKPDGSADVIVQMKFSAAGTWSTILTANVPNIPATYKFGVSSSTGNAGDVHLIRNVQVKTVNALTGLGIVKTDNVASPLHRSAYAEGDQIPYSFTVTNYGAEALDNVQVVDPAVSGVVCPAAPLTLAAAGHPGASATCTGTHMVTADEAAAASGQFVNTAHATGTSTTSQTMVESDPSTETVPLVAPATGIILTKTETAPHNPAKVGDTISYGFSVRNTGNVTLAPVTISDSTLGISGGACVATLAPGAAATCTVTGGSHLITEADVLAGSLAPATYAYSNTATATGVPPGTLPNSSDDDTVQTPLVAAAPGIELTKSSSVSGSHNPAQVGDTISYSFSVKNTGNVTLAPVTISDPTLEISDGACVDTLAPNATATCTLTGTHVVTHEDIEAGTTYDNTATATGTDGNETSVDGSDDESVALEDGAPLIKITKTGTVVSGNNPAQLGDVINYTFSVENTGNVTLAPVKVTDATLGITAATCVSSLAPGATATCSATGSHTVTQGDLIAGSPYTNTVTATGTSTAPSGPATATDDDQWNTPLTPATATIALTKSASPTHTAADPAALGDAIDYSFSVQNTGNVTLAPVTVTDSKLGISNGACVATLAPGATATCTVTGTHTISSVDILAGSPYTNTATATGVPPSGSGLANAKDTDFVDTVLEAPSAGITLNKIADPDHTPAQLGDSISYTFEVTNSGNVALAPVTINDAKLGITDGACVATLAPGATKTCTVTGTHVVAEADILAGSTYENTATATGTPPTGSGLPDATDTDLAAVTLAAATPQIVLEKIADPDHAPAQLGDSISYTFKVTNSGNVTLAPVTINDAKLGITDGACVDTLAPGSTTTCTVTGTHEVVEEDLGANYVNTATSAGVPPASTGLEPVTDQDAESTPTATPLTGLTLDKKATVTGLDAVGDVGEVISYTFTVRNSGNVTLNNLVVNDSTLGVANLLCAATLLPGASADCTAPVTHTVTSDDIVAGQVDNLATADGTSARSDVADPAQTSDSETVYTREPGPGIGLVKHAELADKNDNGVADVGEVIHYSFTVTNSGNVTLAPVKIADPALGITGLECADSLEPSASVTCLATKTHTVTEADLIAGKVINEATATGELPDGVSGPAPSSTDDAVTPTTRANPGLALVKKAKLADKDGNGKAGLDEKITYTFVVTNSGNVTLSNITVTDPMIGSVSCPQASLAPGKSMTCTGDRVHVVTAANVAAGTVDNTATVSASSPTGVPAPKKATDSVSVTTTGADHKPTSTPTPKPDDELALTGADVTRALGLAVLLFAGGWVLALGARRRRKHGDA